MHFRLKTMIIPDTNDFHNTIEDMMAASAPERLEAAASDKANIEAITSAAELVKLMRRGQDPLNQDAIVKKAMVLENEVIPDVLKRFKTNMTTEFIEMATQVLGKSKMEVAETIIGYFDEIRSPYARSMALILIGFKAGEGRIPWLISKYHELEKKYPQEDYHQGAYYGLCEMEERFY